MSWTNRFKKFGFLFCVAHLTCLNLHGEEPSYTPIEDKVKLPIYTPALSKRETLKVRLKNGLEAYLVSDPQAKKSGATLSVMVGSWEDPKEYPGIAHFLEHLLFLGTKKYPQESEYSQFIAEHGGAANAFTTNNATSYLFTVDNQAFPQALDRFSQFFKEPLFNPSGVERELKAIDQEYAKNVENDDFRQIYIHKELSNQDHPNYAFNMGNSQSLKKVSREVLIDWYHKHYSANLMKLVVFSSEPLSQLLAQVVEDFSDVPNIQKELFSTTAPGFANENRGNIIYINPLKNLRTLAFIWEMPSQFAEFSEAKPKDLICYILGHEGKESLLAQLKRENLAEGLRCGGVKTGEKMCEFYLDIDMTQEGLRDVDTVILRTFQAIANLRQKGIPPYLFNELQKIETINYQYQVRKDEFVDLMKHSSLIIHEPLETYPVRSEIIGHYDAQLVQEFLEALTPERAEIQVLASPAESGVEPTRKEKWLGGEYALQPIPQDIMQAWKNAQSHPAIDLPEPNPFVPQHLTLKYPLDKTKDKGYLPEPSKLIDDDKMLFHFAPDTRYREPKIYWSYYFRTPQVVSDDPNKLVMADLYAKGVTEKLNELSYPAKLAGLDFKIEPSRNGIIVTLSGYNENAYILFEKILDAMKNFEMTKENLELYKDVLLRDYLNFYQEMPVWQAIESLREILYKQYTSHKQKANAIRKITLEQFKAYQNQLFQKSFIEALLYGNMEEAEALKTADLLKKQFSFSPYPKKDWAEVDIVVLKQDGAPYYLDTETKSQGNAVILSLESEPFSFKNRAAQQVVMQALKDPFFSTLRTKQQTGYITFSSAEEIKQHLFNMFAVQSSTHSPRDLLARFELFIEGFLQELKHTYLREEQFLAIKSALLVQAQEPPKNLVDMGRVLQLLAFEYRGDFKWLDKRIEGLKGLTYEDSLNYAFDILGKKNSARIGVLMKGSQSEDNILEYTKIRSIGEFKKNNLYTPFKG